eukprot:CAMPEP_0197521022 /NCGR_PEP_ID=MMETSP1318-20131121/6329_1 /TAXON_ID=552666 /ORGANISM="Partenskyella glossopodia, Strain RCC365" /LENGTH=339 /DNA_ID=CAMNT_0043072827 /DNA_START=542 /DNA_END=1561 /DNA_ORIENTATION=+
MQKAEDLNRKVAPYRPTQFDKDHGNTIQLDGVYMAEAFDLTNGENHSYGPVLKDLLNCYQDMAKAKHVGVGVTFAVWFHGGADTDICTIKDDEGRMRQRIKGRLKQELDRDQVHYFTPEQQRKFILKLNDRNGKIKFSVEALGGELGPNCPDDEVLTNALSASQRNRHNDDFCKRHDLPFTCNLTYTGNPFPPKTCPELNVHGTDEEKVKSVILFPWVMRNNGSHDIVKMGIHYPGLIHHSSFNAGLPVKAAGMLQMYVLPGSGDMRLAAILSKSGHYKPPAETMEHMVKFLIDNGMRSRKYWCGSNGVWCLSMASDAPAAHCRDKFPQAFQGMPACQS